MIVDVIMKARRFTDLIRVGETEEAAYHRLAKECHPDLHPNNPQAAEAFIVLVKLYQGDQTPAAVIGKWNIHTPFAKGDLCDLYLTDDDNLFKIARSRSDSDLMKREQHALTLLHKNAKGPQFANYIPVLRDTLTASARQVNIVAYAGGFYSLEDIVSRLKHVEFRHIVWMMNRLLSCLGYVHRQGLVHGAILPSHVLYNPANHDMRLVDWCYSVDAGTPIKAAVTRYRGTYAPELLQKKPAMPHSDIYMAARVLRAAADRIPGEMKALFDWALAEHQLARPDDAWKFQDHWRAAARREFGEPRFLELSIPVQ